MDVQEKSLMNFDSYQKDALRTCGPTNSREKLVMSALGLAGEAGEAIDHVKKVIFHGHTLDAQALGKELGDILWYVSVMADAIGYNLSYIAQCNIDKLRKRYPNGFEEEKSKNRNI